MWSNFHLCICFQLRMSSKLRILIWTFSPNLVWFRNSGNFEVFRLSCWWNHRWWSCAILYEDGPNPRWSYSLEARSQVCIHPFPAINSVFDVFHALLLTFRSRAAGYDENLTLCGARGFILSIHTTCKIVCQRQAHDPALLEEAIERPIVAFGTQKVRCYFLWGMPFLCCITYSTFLSPLFCSQISFSLSLFYLWPFRVCKEVRSLSMSSAPAIMGSPWQFKTISSFH
jgi:hypothetical protein